MDEEPPVRTDLEVDSPARLPAWPSQGEDPLPAELLETPPVAPGDPRPIELWIADHVEERGEPIAFLPAAAVMELWRGRDGTLAELCHTALDAALARVERESALGDEWYPTPRPPVAILVDAGFLRTTIDVDADVLDRVGHFLADEHGRPPPRNLPGAVLAWAFAVALEDDGLAPPEAAVPAREGSAASGRLPRWQPPVVDGAVAREELLETLRLLVARL